MEQFLWVEQYRPQNIESCVLPKTLKDSLQSFVDEETLPNLIFSGGPGVGKTTAARAMVNQIGATYMMINGSEESDISYRLQEIQ
jgi:replication-associated recombination protein RarA